MPDVPQDELREQRIHNEILIDAYSPEEQALSWYYYLENALAFPFVARCTHERLTSPLQVDDEVEVVGMPPEEVCAHEIFVLTAWEARTLAVPLAQLEGTTANAETAGAIADWHYWLARGYEL
jgi:hypothetical protein